MIIASLPIETCNWLTSLQAFNWNKRFCQANLRWTFIFSHRTIQMRYLFGLFVNSFVWRISTFKWLKIDCFLHWLSNWWCSVSNWNAHSNELKLIATCFWLNILENCVNYATRMDNLLVSGIKIIIIICPLNFKENECNFWLKKRLISKQKNSLC